jgi:hypothetical protein
VYFLGCVFVDESASEFPHECKNSWRVNNEHLEQDLGIVILRNFRCFSKQSPHIRLHQFHRYTLQIKDSNVLLHAMSKRLRAAYKLVFEQ